MLINIYTKNNGVGLEADAKLLQSVLTGHDIKIVDWERPAIRRCDVGIHLEHIRTELCSLSHYNISIPNPEWFEAGWMNRLKRVNAVYCKTRFTYDVFSKLHDNCIYCGWTSIDKYLQGVEKRWMFLHLAGKSKHKGTEAITAVWRGSDLPLLYLQKLENFKGFVINQPNVINQFKRVPDIREIMNQSLFHLCPSKAEGFGHYINEGLSAGAVVITSDAAPMNELVTSDCGFIVPVNHCGKHHLSNEYCVDIPKLKETVLTAINTPVETLLQMSMKARQNFLRRDAEFRVMINALINKIE